MRSRKRTKARTLSSAHYSYDMYRKLIKLLTLAFIAGSVLSCTYQHWTAIDWHIENNSGKDIIIVNAINKNEVPISIPNGDIYKESVAGGGWIPGPFNDAKVINVIFDNERIINYDTRNGSGWDVFHNPLIWDNYEDVLIKEDKLHKEYEYRYTFVPEQYEMAEPYDPDAPRQEEDDGPQADEP